MQEAIVAFIFKVFSLARLAYIAEHLAILQCINTSIITEEKDGRRLHVDAGS